MGIAFWASQPTSVNGTAGSTSVAMTSHVSQFDIDESTESFFGQFNNEKYERAGGVVAHTKAVSMTSHDMSLLESAKGNALRAGTLWRDVKVVYAAEGASAGSTDMGDMTATIDQMLIESSAKADAGGRLAINAAGRLISEDGSTDPITYSVADS